jgi:hypothetical protein
MVRSARIRICTLPRSTTCGAVSPQNDGNPAPSNVALPQSSVTDGAVLGS